MSFRLFWLATGLIFLSGLCWGAGREDLSQLTNQLSSSGNKGKVGSKFIVNRGVGDAAKQDESTTKLAREVGFVDPEGNTDPVVLSVPMAGSADWIGAVTKLQQEGKLRSATALDVGSPAEIVQ